MARAELISAWLNAVYGHDTDRPQPARAARLLEENPDLPQAGLLIVCAIGDESALRQTISADPAVINRSTSGWPCPRCNQVFDPPPLVAVTHSSLLRLPQFRDRLHACARLLLDSGADANQFWTDGQYPLSALFGAAGKNQDPALAKMLLDAGARPNDNESLYHSVEAPDPSCTRLLLAAGASVDGTNAIHHQLDYDNLDGLRLLLAHTKDPDKASPTLGSPVRWAILRGRSIDHVKELLKAGASPANAYRFAMLYGCPDIAAELERAGAAEPLSIEDQFVAACASGNKEAARTILSQHPNIVTELSPAQLRQLPNLAQTGNLRGVQAMVELGWPVAVQGGDWRASALNLAVFRGDAVMTRWLLEHGASWTERHGYDDNASGTLSWASRNHDPEEGDWVGCAAALADHGMPMSSDGYSEPVNQFFRAMTDLSYPIGKFEFPETSLPAQRAAWVEEIAQTPSLLSDAVRGLSESQLDTPYRPGGWTVRQVAHHVPDSHMNAYVRFKLALTEDNPVIKPYDEAAWAKQPDTQLTPVQVSLALLEALHTRWVTLLKAMHDSDFDRRFQHPESGAMRLDQYLALYAWHGKHHVAHITSLRARMGWS